MTDLNREMGVIFDLDGVLVDTGQWHRGAWDDLAQKEGLVMSDEFFRQTFGMQNYQIIPMLAGQDLPRDEIDRMSEWKERRYRELILGKLELLEGVAELLGELMDAGFRLAVGTSTPQVNLAFMLEHLPLKDSFDAYVTGEDVAHGKPAPDTFLRAAEKLGLEPGRCVVVEDAVAGIQAALAASMPVVAVTTTRNRSELAQAALIVDSLAELGAGDFVKLLSGRKKD